MRQVFVTVAAVLLCALNCASGEPEILADGGGSSGAGGQVLTADEGEVATVWTRKGDREAKEGPAAESKGAKEGPAAGTREAKEGPAAGTREAKEGPAAGNPEAKEGPAADDKEDRIWNRVAGCRPVEVEKPDDLTEGQMRVITDDGVMALPLAHTSVDAEVSGMLARVWVTQYFTNPYDHPIEAVYVFPLPQTSAVDDMEMHIGDRVVRGIMKEREEAREIYEKAKRQGKTASLLEQERPNIFTQSVANILPGDHIKVRIRYVEDLKYDDGSYEFVFPMVVGPRFIPGAPVGKQADGWSPDTDKVPDASRITPPVLKPGERSGHDIDVTLTINSGVEVVEMKSPSHDLDVKELGNNALEVTLQPHDTIPNKDLIVKFKTAGDKLSVASLFHASKSGRYFMLVFQPQERPADEEVVPRELVFVLDCSGSMSGAPLAKVKEAVKKSLRAMRPDDKFQVFMFSESARGFAPRPVENTPENLKRAIQYVDQLQSEGGTMMIEGIKAALDYPTDPKRMRIVAFMTDGYIGNDDEIIAAVKKKVGDSRLFSFGIGSSVNRYLLDNMARAGRGKVTYVRQDEPANEAVERFYRSIDSPVLADIEVKTEGNVEVSEVNPMPISDLFAGSPLVVHGKYDGDGAATFVITGRQGDRDFNEEVNVTFPSDEPENGVLATLWARTKIEYLMEKMLRGEDPDVVKQVTELAIKFQIMSKYTSFVAVEEKVRNKGGSFETIQVPVEIPEGVSYEGVFGEGSGSLGQAGIGGGGAYPAAAPVRTRGLRMSKQEAFNAPAGGPVAVTATAGDTAAAAEPMEKMAEETEAESQGWAKGKKGADKDDGKAATGHAGALAVACSLEIDSVVILEGPLSEKEVQSALKARFNAIASGVESACQAEGSFPDETLVDVSLKIDASGSVTVKSVTVRNGSSAFKSKAIKAFEKQLATLQFAGDSLPTLAKVSLRLTCR